MRVLLVHPSPLLYSELYLRLEPLGLERVAAAVRAAGHEVRLLDLQVFGHADYLRELAQWQPRAVGFSLNYLANVPEVIDLAKTTRRQRPEAFVFVGGHSASFIADELLGLHWKPLRVLDEAARIEGHPDNVAACVLGSIVASAIDSGGVAHAVRLELDRHYGVAVVVPDFIVATAEARRVLPDTYSREDTIFNVQRSALLIAALTSGVTSAFPAALEDRLHQPHRFALVPGLEEITRLRAPGLLGCALSGAGPSILVFYERGHEEVCDLVRQVFAAHGHGSETMWVHIASCGYQMALS